LIEYIDLTIDFAKRNDRLNGITLDRVTTRSYDTAIKFRIEIIGHTLDDTYDVKILTKYHKSGLKVMTALGDSLAIVDGKLIYTPKVNLIAEADYVRNYLYLSKDGLGLDMAQFNYEVDVSQIGEVAVEVRQVYDESYEVLLAEFEQGADALLKTVEGNESARVNAEATRKTAETDRASSETTRKTNETTRISNEDARKSAETIRLASETSRVNAENTRKGFYEGFGDELGKKANKQQEAWITPTLLNGWSLYDVNNPLAYRKNSFGVVEHKGAIKGGLSGTSPYTYTVGYRPKEKMLLLPNASSGAFVGGRINSVGVLTLNFTGNASSVDLSGMTFVAEG